MRRDHRGARAIEARAPHGRAVISPSVAHMIVLEATAQQAGLIIAFVEPLRPWS